MTSTVVGRPCVGGGSWTCSPETGGPAAGQQLAGGVNRWSSQATDPSGHPSSVGTAQDSRNLRKEFRTYAEASGFRHSFHEFRHFFATVASSEVTLESLSKVLGHRRRATTSDIYGHLYEPDARKVTNAVERVLRADDRA